MGRIGSQGEWAVGCESTDPVQEYRPPTMYRASGCEEQWGGMEEAGDAVACSNVGIAGLRRGASPIRKRGWGYLLDIVHLGRRQVHPHERMDGLEDRINA